MTLYPLAIVQTKKMLDNVAAWLDQAVEHAKANSFDPGNLLTFRLAPDQFALLRQIQIVCDTAKLTAARLAGKEAPVHEDTETTFEALQSRLRDVRAFLDTFTEADLEGAETRLVPVRFAPGQGSRGGEYYRSFAQPNFFFHVTHVYALLRHAGVPVGKRAFIGSLEMEPLE